MLTVGSLSPAWTAVDQDGKARSSADYLGSWLLLYFYPKDDTYNCIVESSEFRDRYNDFKNAGAEIIGISSDNPNSHAEFAKKYELPFPLLSDQKNEVRELYGVPSTLGFIPGRVTFVIDKSGKVRHVFNSQFDPKSHVSQALSILKNIKST
jgi:peroxiredoxin Q/BCP